MMIRERCANVRSRGEQIVSNQKNNGEGRSKDEKREAPTKGPEVVITPGGPRPSDQVHLVGPGEVVQGVAGGQPVVALGQPIRLRDQATADLVLTPGGWRPKSAVHHIEPGMVLDTSGD